MKNFVKTIEFILSRLDGKPIKWAFVGDANLFIQGIDVEPDSIIISTSRYGGYEISQLFKDKVLRPFSLVISRKGKKEISYYLGTFKVYGTLFKVVADLRINNNEVYPVNAMSRVCYVFENHIVPVLDLSYEEKAKKMLKGISIE